MKKVTQALSLAMVFVLAGFNLAVMAQRPNRGTIQQVRQRLNGLDTDFARFNGNLNVAMNNRSRTNGQEDIDRYVRDFQQASTRFRNRLDANRADASDMQNLLERGTEIDRFIANGQFPGNVQNNCVTVKADLDLLASNYNVNSTWVTQANTSYGSNEGYRNGGNRNGGSRNRLSGTFQLDRSRSDNVQTVVRRATRTVPYRERETISSSLISRLEPPDMISLDRQGRNVTLASSKGNRITFDADGEAHNEQVSSGRSVRMQATLTGDQLVISTTGNRSTDFSATFEPIENGRSLRVTRRVYSDQITQPIVFTSIYTRTSEQPQWDIYTSTGSIPGNRIPNDRDRGRDGDYWIPNGTSLTAVLNTNLSTRNSRENDRFTMTVESPSEYNGAVIEGYISNLSSSGSVTGRANMSLNFQQIRMPNGQTRRFDGFIDNIRTPDGEVLQVNNEGNVRDADSQGTKTAERAGIGAAIGAVIGAIAGGGKGAGIGAVIGGGAGAGSVVVQGRDQLDLLSGSRVQLTASAPNR